MITKGEIKSINQNDNTCVIHVPLFDTAGFPEKTTLTATFANMPGLYNNYAVGDIVYVGFENNEIDLAVVVGKLFVSTNSEKNRTIGGIAGSDLKITNSVSLPTNTMIGDLSGTDLANLNGKLNTIEDLVNTKSNNDTFSTNEQIIGKWIDGKLLYRKTYIINHNPVIPIGAFGPTGVSIADLNFENIWLDMTHTIQIGDRYSLNAYCTTTQPDYFNCYIDTSDNATTGKKIFYRGYAPDNISKHIITVEYTKK